MQEFEKFISVVAEAATDYPNEWGEEIIEDLTFRGEELIQLPDVRI